MQNKSNEKWLKGAVATPEGWRDPDTNELLKCKKGLNDGKAKKTPTKTASKPVTAPKKKSAPKGKAKKKVAEKGLMDSLKETLEDLAK